MSDTREPKEYLLGNAITIQCVWTHPETGAILTDLSPGQMACWVQHEDDSLGSQAGTVRNGTGIGVFEADFLPTRRGIWHYLFFYPGPPQAVQDGDFEMVPSDVTIP